MTAGRLARTLAQGKKVVAKEPSAEKPPPKVFAAKEHKYSRDYSEGNPAL